MVVFGEKNFRFGKFNTFVGYFIYYVSRRLNELFKEGGYKSRDNWNYVVVMSDY